MSALHQQFIKDSLFRFGEHLPRIQNCLERLSEEEIWRSPNASSNSIGNLILHLSGNIKQYLISGLGGAPDDRQRDKEFEIQNQLTKQDLLQGLQNIVELAAKEIAACNEEQLIHIHHIQGFKLSGCDAIIHVIEHFSYHTGQIALLTKWLRNEDLGFYEGLDLNT